MPIKHNLSYLTASPAAWLLGIILIIAFSCDTLEEDIIVTDSKVELSDEPIMISPGKSDLIDLTSLIKKTSGAYTLTVTTEPKLGFLDAVGDYLLRYTPKIGVQQGSDFFIVSFFGKDSTVVGQDSVHIIITPACHVRAEDDYVSGVKSAVPVIINVLANDSLCTSDSTVFMVTLLDGKNGGITSYGAAHGKTEVLTGGRIRYTPDNTFKDVDSFMYKISKVGGGPTSIESIATVYILADSVPSDSIPSDSAACTALPQAMDDYFTYPFSILVGDSTSQDSTVHYFGPFTLDVLSNDVWCGETPTWEVVQMPDGKLTILSDVMFSYMLPAGVEIHRGYEDHFRYRIYSNGGWSEANVTIRFY